MKFSPIGGPRPANAGVLRKRPVIPSSRPAAWPVTERSGNDG